MTDILDLPGWRVISSEQDQDTYTIEAEYEAPLEACTKCGVIGRLYRHGTKPVTYRDAPIRGLHTQILARVQRYRCRDCGGTSLQALGGIRHDRRMTERCIAYVEGQATRDSWTRIAEHVGCDEKTVRNVAQAFIDRFNHDYRPTMPEWLGIDETKLAGSMRGIFTDVMNCQPVDMIPTRDSRAVAQWLHSNRARERVKVVATDMHRPYHKVVHDLLPGVPVVVDKFHVVRMAGNGVDKARIRLGKAAGKKTNLGWKRSKTLLNTGRHKLTEKQLWNLDMWLDNEPELAEAYWLKESFYDFYELPKDDAIQAFDEWIERCKASPVKGDFKEILSALKNWREPILAYFDYRITNGYTESLNSVTKVVNRQSRGYSFDVIRARILGRAEVLRKKRKRKAKPTPPPAAPEIMTGTRPAQEVFMELRALVEEAEGRCHSCGGVFDEDDLVFHHEGTPMPIFEIQEKVVVMCKQCSRRLHMKPEYEASQLKG